MYINGHSHSYTTKHNVHMHTIIVTYLLSFADTDVEKCIARTDNEGWALICAGGEAEIGE